MKNSFTKNLTRKMLLFSGLLLIAAFSFAQNKQENGGIPVGVPFAEKDPNVTMSQNNTTPTPPALWDVEFNYDATTLSGGVLGQAGVAYIGHEFWTSQWASDTIRRFSPTGSYRGFFTIAGVSGTRAITFDGTSVYVSNNTATIYKIDTATKSVTGVINAPITQVRMCTYDPTANSGAGGFWIGNFNTDITLINMSGGVISTITAATHGLGGMYGCAFENQTAGSPYLWVFHQGGTSSQAEIARLQLPSGTPTIVTHDVMSDVGASLTSGLAGGLFISNQIVPGEWTIIGMLQGSPTNQLFGYELNDFLQPAVDAGLDEMRNNSGYTQVPVNHVTGMQFEAVLSNLGTSSLGTVEYHVDVYNSSMSQVFTDVQTVSNVAAGATTTVSSNPYTPGSVDTYTAYGYAVVTGGQNDTVSGNDSTMFEFAITDSTFARDNGIPDGGNGYAVSTTNWAYAVALYQTQIADTLSSVTIEIATPVDLDTTYAVIASTVGGFPDAVIATGSVNIISSAQNTYNLTFPGGVALTPGVYAIGCYEGANTTINLAQSSSIFTPGTNFFYTGGAWTQSGIQTARFIRPNFGSPVAVGIEDGLSENGVSIYPNPNAGNFAIQLHGYQDDASVSVMNTLGQVVYSGTIESGYSRINLANQESGIYLVRIETNENTVIKKVNISR